MAVMFFTTSKGQATDPLDSLENTTFQIRQRPGTDGMLRQWLTDCGVKEDTVYAFIHVTAVNPRLESSLKFYSDYFKKHNEKFLLISIFDDKNTAALYNKLHGYTADYHLYDTTNHYEKIFSLNTIAFNTPFIMKLTKSGRLIAAFEGTYYSKELMNMLTGSTEPLEYKNFDTQAEFHDWTYKIPADIRNITDKHKDYKLNCSEDMPLGKTFRIPYFVDNTFMYPDKVWNSVQLFTRNNNSGEFDFKRALAPTEKESYMFVSVDSATLKQMVRLNIVHCLLVNAWMLDKEHIGMSYSLPKLFTEASGNTAYYNEPCILSRRIGDLQPSAYTDLDVDLSREKYFYEHFQFCSTGDKIIIGCEKMTWPMELEPDEYRGNTEFDPFDKGFYDTDNPFMAAFDRHTGKLITRFGHIDDIARKTFTGYCYVRPLAMVCGQELAYTDSYSGKVYVADTADITKDKFCYEVFKIDDSLLPPVDTTKFYSYEQAKRYKNVFCRTIEDLRITADKLYCVVMYGDASDPNPDNRYTLVTIDRKTGERSEQAYPQEEGYNRFTLGLREKDGKVYPFELLKNKNEAILRVYGETAE